MKGRRLTISKLKISSVLIFVLGWLSFLGSLEITAIGHKIYLTIEKYAGEFAWMIPFVLMILAVIGWLSTSQPLFKLEVGRVASKDKASPKKATRKKATQKELRYRQSELTDYPERTKNSEIELPSSRLVSLHGFRDYFSSPELDIQTAAAREDLSEIGSDFNTYFQKDRCYPKATKVASINGFSDYFRSTESDNDQEFEQRLAESPNLHETLDRALTEYEIEKDFDRSAPPTANLDKEKPRKDDLSDKTIEKEEPHYPGQVAQLVQRSRPDTKDAGWQLPDVSLLNAPMHQEVFIGEDEDNTRILEEVLLSFGIKCTVVDISHGPVITRYELVPAPGVKISRIVNLADDIALALAARDVRIEAPIPGKSAIGIEVPNKEAGTVTFREVIESVEYQRNTSLLKVALGKDITGKPVIADLTKMPHLLVAGATGSGKSVCVNTIINSILFNAQPEEVKLMLIDPKMVELSNFNGIPHLLTPVVTDSKAAASFLKWAVKEMETRYELFAANGVRDISSYNALIRQNKQTEEGISKPLPLIVIVIDELADLMMVSANDVEEAICRLAQMARAAGMHLIIATQRPSVDVITGIIKANIPSRIAFAVTSQIDSRTILDSAGAERLLGKGDMLFSPIGLNKPLRVQGCFIDDEEARQVIEHWKGQGRPDYLAPETFITSVQEDTETVVPGDELFIEAAKLVISTEMASVSYLQRKFKIGYARAARLIDLLEEEGIVGGYEGPKPRQVIMNMDQFLQKFPENMD